MKSVPSAPLIRAIKNIKLPAIETNQLSNGLPVRFMMMGTQQVAKIEIVFWAGRPYEENQLIARTTAALIKEGTLDISSQAIAETFDFHGASLSTPVQTDVSSFSIYCLSKQIKQVLPILIELLKSPAFRTEDLQAYIIRQQHRLKEDLCKNDVLAYRHITACFYGKNHPYGYNSFPNSYDYLTPDLLHKHHQRCYNANNGFALISGQVDADTQAFICKELERIPSGKIQRAIPFTEVKQLSETIQLSGQGQMQSAIRMGRKLFARSHPDASGVYMLMTILGGYFGSRLMANIREQKGYTYQISGTYESLRFEGSLQIDTEVSPEFVAPCLKEIQFEVERLQNDLVSEKEMTMVRNYLMGSFLSMVDGPFNWSETLRTLSIEQLNVADFQSLIMTVKQMNSQQIRGLAQAYLKKEDLWTVVVGE